MQHSLPLPAPGQSERVNALVAGVDSLALAQLAQRLAQGKSVRTPLVIITASAAEAQRLLEEIPWFAPELCVNLLPDWETLPYDHFSPHPDLISERLATLSHFSGGGGEGSVVAASTRPHLLG